MIPTWKDIVLVCFCWARRLADSRRRPADRHKRQVACVQHPLPHCRVFVVGRGRPYTTVDKNLVLEYFRPGFPEILGLIAFLFTLFKGCRCNQLYVITPDNFLWEPEKKNFKFHLNWGNTGENLHASDFILWNLKLWKFVFSGSHKNLFFRVISCNLWQGNVKECDTVEPVLSGTVLSGRFFKVPKIASLVNWSTVISTSIKRSPLLSGRGHHLRSPYGHTVSVSNVLTHEVQQSDFLVYFRKSLKHRKWMLLFEVKRLIRSALVVCYTAVFIVVTQRS